MSTIHTAVALASGLICTLLLIKLAPALHLIDHPGGRKEHSAVTPLVGGIGIAVVLLAYLALAASPQALVMAAAVIILMVVGVADDIMEIKPLPKFAVQAVACAVMAQGASITLRTVGDLAGIGPVGMWIFALPVTLFAIIGVINAINMFDGIDGHAGGVALVAFVAYAWVARESGLVAQHHTLLVLAGATLGFMLLNARFPWNARARTFLGDAGSMLLGFLIGWFAIDLTAGNGSPSAVAKTFPPICGLWVIVIPLCDCVSLMLRRKLAHRSMFVADRQHLHHYLLNRGLSVGQASAFSFVLNAICASVGVLGWKFGVPESALFAGFVSLFVVYHWHMLRAFRVMPTHSNMGPSST
jgi:UDP-GlcNAc:undecaprenyl-phosphate GlcNAc-1-phosphate transferase